AADENPFAEIIRKTEPLSPVQEQKAFHLPPGFEIQLVAAEPDITKPMNMAFDGKGRLWVTQSREYPFPVLTGKGRDAIRVLENFNANGRAEKITTFADGLNIPIGLYPYRNGVIAFSIPNISFFQDTDGDGRADKQEVLYGPVGFEKDTHGMTSAFRCGYDGWLYACHGFNNTTTLTGKDGSSITMNSGNTYRMRLDGSRVEQFTWGQVNPFGLAFDPLGNLYSADCHSSPIYQLIRGAHYPSFGKPHEGLGFAPVMMDHSHGSTAIGGIVFYSDTQFPTAFRKNFFIGNVMTCRINRNSIIEHGATWRAKEEPDFLSCDDPWFRPVDLQLGPDGAIYIADFYNRIIGHYEAPLDHPGRDRERGRIWRIVYRGTNLAKSFVAQNPKLRDDKASAADLIKELGNANITRRMLATSELTDRIGASAIKPLEKTFFKSTNSFQKLHAMWALQRLGSKNEIILDRAAKDSAVEVRVHGMRILGEMAEWNPARQKLAFAGLLDSDPLVRRAACEALGLHPDFANIQPILAARPKIETEDTHSLHVSRIALRNQLIPEGIFQRVQESHLNTEDSRAIADVALGVPNSGAADFVLMHVQKFDGEDREKLNLYLRHIARYAASGSEKLAAFTENKFSDDIDFQFVLFKAIQEGAAQRGRDLSQASRDWGTRLAEKLLASVDKNSLEWRNSSIQGNDTTNPWFLQQREAADKKRTQFICSLPPDGEKLTGILRSKSFLIPASLRFYLAGHDGFPDQPMRDKNFVRLRDEKTQKILASALPPRNDIAQIVTWDLGAFVGQKGFLELVDGNTGTAYAWLAFGRLSPPVVSLTNMSNQVEQRQQAAAKLAAALHLGKLEPQLAQILRDETADVATRAAAAQALTVIKPKAHLIEFGNLLQEGTAPEKLRETLAQVLSDINSSDSRKVLLAALPNSPGTLQTKISLALASSAEGAEALLQFAEQGKVSARLLQENAVRDRLFTLKRTDVKPRLDKLVADLTPLSVEKQKLIDERRVKFSQAENSVELGQKIFTQSCAVCHQLDKQGAVVGPQLDGVGNRGGDRLIEDILDPNRNVDRAFRTTLVVMKDGDVQSGLFRRQEGETLVLADATGKEISIPQQQIKERRESESSLMPDNFSDVITPEDFNNLIAFLLSKGNKAQK
ncbi:MAG: PVC-type heme-binding CxxCH protein, partial [Verrucomicrobiota bacterium]